MRKIFYPIMIVMFVLVTFFGLGPVLLGDGSMAERIQTLLMVLAAYALIFWNIYRFKKRGGTEGTAFTYSKAGSRRSPGRNKKKKR